MTSPHSPAAPPPHAKGGPRHALTVWGGIVAVSLAVLIGTYLLFVEAPPPRRLVIATGSPEGAYYHFAKRYAELLEREGLTLEVRATNGSVENLQLLQDDQSGVAVAIVQSGVAGEADRTSGRLQALGSLYREPLWVFYRGTSPIDRLGLLSGKRLAVGPPGSGTRAIALQLLADNGVKPASDSAADRTMFLEDSGSAAAEALKHGDLDAAFFVASMDASYLRPLFDAEGVRLLNFSQQQAYLRRYRFLSGVTVPEGLVELGRNIPAKDVALVAPAAVLVSRHDLHPALVPLLLSTAGQVHGPGDLLSGPGEFPSKHFTDLPLSKDAHQYFKSGPPVLQRLLPFWLASLTDRLKVMIIPLVVLLWPLLRAAPPLVRWRTRRKIYLWYAALRDIDQKVQRAAGDEQLTEESGRLRAIEQQVSHVEVPLSYMEEFYNLKLHLALVREQLEKTCAERGLAANAAK